VSAAASRVAIGAVLAVVAAVLSYGLCALGMPPFAAALAAFFAVFGGVWIGGERLTASARAVELIAQAQSANDSMGDRG
jgi:apolipoprotein N-acyltransferase